MAAPSVRAASALSFQQTTTLRNVSSPVFLGAMIKGRQRGAGLSSPGWAASHPLSQGEPVPSRRDGAHAEEPFHGVAALFQPTCGHAS